MLCTECKKSKKNVFLTRKKKMHSPPKSVQRRTYNIEIKAFSRFDTFDWCYAYAYNGVHSFWLIMLPNLPQDNSVLANNCANICQTAKEYIGI